MIYLCYKVIKEKIVLQILVVPKCFTNFDNFDHTCFKQTQNLITQPFIQNFVFKIVCDKNGGFLIVKQRETSYLRSNLKKIINRAPIA